MTGGRVPEGLVTATLRAAIPRAIAVVARRWGDFHDAEDAVQEAALSASRVWPRDGLPESPVAWVVAAASRRMIDAIRADQSRRARELRATALELVEPATVHRDDTLALLLMCCHPSLEPGAQLPLTLRAVGGLTTREIARGLMLRESTVAQRISRAKATIRRAGARFALPEPSEVASRIPTVLDVIGLIHTESHSATEGVSIARPGLAAEALRIGRELLRHAPRDAPWRGEVLGLVALMLLTNAREPARIDPTGLPIPLAEQDRRLWRRDLIAEGDGLLREALADYPLGVFQLRAAIAGVHAAAPSYAATDWREIAGLYDLLRVLAPGPVTELARLVAVAELEGAESALRALERLDQDAPVARVAAVRAHLLARAGHDPSAALREAAAAATNAAERRWFEQRAVAGGAHSGG
ncbi:RNA polymerase sigma factor [Microbacterium paludicola]|uniref:RNA polymerase sigma factor n=1 Tax=Microbacterium paludicola TaxID=300019 RepID=UPI00387A4BEF